MHLSTGSGMNENKQSCPSLSQAKAEIGAKRASVRKCTTSKLDTGLFEPYFTI